MGEPVTTGMMIGAASGALMNRKNPIQGAMLGGAMGAAGGSFYGGAAGATGAGGGFAGGGFGSIGTAGQTASTSPFSLGSILNGIGTNFAAGGDPVKGAAMNAAAYSGSGASGFPVNPEIGSNAILGSETLGGVWKDISAANTWMNQNPTTSQIGFKLAQEAMQAPEQIPMPSGMPVNRGQIQPMDYMSLLAPQQSQVLRPATPSLI